jgi:predicted DNA-binding protein
MDDPATIQLDLPPELYQRLEAEAQRQDTPLSDLVREAIFEYLETLDEFSEETPEDEIETGFLKGWRDVATGQTRSAQEVLTELRTTETDDHSG